MGKGWVRNNYWGCADVTMLQRSVFRVGVERSPLPWTPAANPLDRIFLYIFVGFWGRLFKPVCRLSPCLEKKITEAGVSSTALVDSHLCETQPLENQWGAAAVTCWWTAGRGEGASTPRRWSRTCTCIWSEVSAVERKNERGRRSRAGILWPSDRRVQDSFIYLSLEASKLGEKELPAVKQERVNFLSKKYSSSGGSSVLFLEMDKVIF